MSLFQEKDRTQSRAFLQLGFGIAQTFGASLAIVLMIMEGPSLRAVGVAIFTGILTVCSRILFSRPSKH